MRYLKWIVLIIIVLIVGVALAAYVILSSYDYNKLKPKIAQAVMDATGRELKMSGNIKFNFGFTPSLFVEDVSFQNAPWGSKPEMATVKRFEAKVALLPLLSKRIDIKRLILVEPNILIETDKSGESNLEFGQKAEAPQPKKEEPGEGELALPALTFNKVQIQDGQFTYEDGKSGKVYAVTVNSLNAAAPGENSPVTIDLKGAYNNKPFEADGTVGPLAKLTQPDEPWPLKLTAKAGGAVVTLDGTVRDAMHVKGMNLNITAEGKSIPEVAKLADVSGAPDLGSFKIALKIDTPAAKTYRFSDLKASLGESDLSGSGEISVANKRPELTAALTAQKLDLRQLSSKDETKSAKSEPETGTESKPKKTKIFSDAPLPVDSLKQVDAQASVQAGQILLPRIALNNLTANITLKDGALTVEPLKATIGGGSLDGHLGLRAGSDDADMDVALSVDQLDLGSMMKDLNITNMLEGNLNADIQVNGRGKSMAELMGGLDGKTIVLMSDGKIYNKYINLLGTDFSSGIFRLLNPAEQKQDYTRLDCLVSRFDIKDGLADSTVLVVNTSAMNVVGNGNINLKTEELDLALKPSPKEGVGVSGIAKLNLSLSELATPFKLRGTLAKPKLGIDTTQSAIAIGKAVGGTALLGPVGLAAPLVSTSEGPTCSAAIEAAKKGVKLSGSTTSGEEKNVAEKATEGVSQGAKEAVEGAGKTLKKFFGE